MSARPFQIPKAKVLIVVKTYPQPSSSYDELVCTAGLLDGETWVRIYPIPFREMDYEDRFKKWEWIELDLEKRPPGKDLRVESYQPRRGIDEEIKVLGPLTHQGKWLWEAKRRHLLRNVYHSIDQLLADKDSTGVSIAVVKPSQILKTYYSKEEIRWTEDHRQGFLGFLPESERRDTFKPVRALPYRFYYNFTTTDGKSRNLMVEDWEIGARFWNALQSEGTEEKAAKEVCAKLYEFSTTCDLHFILGTTRAKHAWADNPFVIIGVFYPPIESTRQLGMGF